MRNGWGEAVLTAAAIVMAARTGQAHECDGRCRSHVCRPLSRSTIRQIHVILSGALKRAVRWRWLSTNPIEHAEPPQQPAANPKPPSPRRPRGS